jgi:hypothetical protein
MNRPLTGAEARAAELQLGPVLTRPTVPCPNCGDQITPETAFHHRADGTPCVLPGEYNEALARREGVVIPKAPTQVLTPEKAPAQGSQPSKPTAKTGRHIYG